MTSNRVAKGRNEYLKRLRKIRPDVVIMIDSDNRLPSAESIESHSELIIQFYRYLSSDLCDGIFANTIGGYYDIWALRSERCPYDCHKMIRSAVNKGMTLEEAQARYLRVHQQR